MTPLLDGRTILVTGAARGIGRAVAEACVSHGARVALADIDGGECAEAAVELGADALAVTMDVSDEGSVAEAMAVVVSRFGTLDGLVNNAAILDEGSADSVPPARFAEVLSVNLTSILRVSQAGLPHLGSGSAVVNTLSTQALFGQPNSAAYASAKGGAAALTRAMAIDFAPRGIRVNAVAPGFIDTRMAITSRGAHEHDDPYFREAYLARRRIPLARPGTPQDCAGAFVFLLSNLSAYVTGQILAVDGGLTATY
jgi:NAD(P)-dependent dehydrogenase (short-subunit alcohol dehydrogenase family)